MNKILDFDVKERLFESNDSFDKKVFDNTINITNKNCIVINDIVFANFLAKMGNQVFCLYFDDNVEVPTDSKVVYEYVKIITSNSSEKVLKESVSNIIKEKFNEYRSRTKSYENGSVDVIFNFSIPTTSSFNYKKVTKINLFLFDLFFEPGITVWYSFDEYDVLTEFQKMKSEYKFKPKVNIIGRKIDNETWRDKFGFDDDTERYFTKFFITDDELLKLSKYNGDEFDCEDLNGIVSFGDGFIKPISEPRIYTFRTDYVDNVLPDDTTAIKIGDTNRDVMQRMNEWGKLFPDIEHLDDWSAVLSGCGEGIDGKIIRDYAVHRVLEESGKERMKDFEFGADNIMNGRYSKEFFKNTTTDDVKNAIDEIHRRAIEGRYDILSKLKDRDDVSETRFIYPSHHILKKFPVRDLQEKTIEKFKERFVDSESMLMYAVMRFGKTYTACRCMKEWEGNFNVIVTGKVGVKNEWLGTINRSSQFFEYDAYTASAKREDGGLTSMLSDDRDFIVVGKDVDGNEIKMRGPHPGKKFKTLKEYFDSKANEHIWWVVKGDDKISDAYYETEEEAISKSDGRDVEKRLVKKKIVLFVSLQDLLGDLRKNKKRTIDDKVEYIKEKHLCFYDYPIDVMIIDEAHFATQSKSLGATIGEGDDSEKYKRVVDEEDVNLDDDDEMRSYEEKETSMSLAKTMNITEDTRKLYLSGTPYNLMIDGKFKEEDIIAKFGFYDLMKAKDDWDKESVEKSEKWLRENEEKRKNGEPYEDENKNPYRKDKNPYFGIPKMISLGYKMDKFHLDKFCQNGEFKFKIFFEAEKDESGKWKFVNEEIILKLFRVIDGVEHDGDLMTILDLPQFKKGNMLKNIVIVLPFRRCCDAFENMMIKHRDEFKHLGDYTIIKATSTTTEIDPDVAKDDILRNVERGNNTITLTVGRLMTGVTVAPWDTMFYMRDLKKPQEYDQAKFRIQSPYIKEVSTIDIDENGKVYNTEPTIIDMKPQTLFVDFSPRRMFDMTKARMFAHSGAIGGCDEEGDVYKMVEDTYNKETNSLPIILMENGSYRLCNGADVVKYIEDNQSRISLSKRLQNIKKYPDPSDMDLLVWEKIKMYDGKKSTSDDKIIDAFVGEEDKTPEELESLMKDYVTGSKTSKRTIIHCTDSEREKLINNFKKKVETIMRDIFMFIILKNDDTEILNFHRLWDAMTHTTPKGVNYELIRSIFLDDLGIEERKDLEETVRVIKNTLQMSICPYLRRCGKLEDFTEMMIQTQKSFKKERNNFENLKEQLKEFGQRIGETEIITSDKIIPKLTEDFVIFNDEKILDCYGSKIGEILNYFATSDKFKDKFDIDNYYMVCRTPLIAELNKPVIKMLYGMKYPKKGFYFIRKKTEMFMKEHILILDPNGEDYRYRVEEVTDETTGKVHTIEHKEVIKNDKYIVCLEESIQRKWKDLKFNFIVGNPPYGVAQKGSSPVLHLKIMNTALKFCTDKLVFIMPSAPITKQLNDYWYNMFVNAVCNRVEVMDKEVFKGTVMEKTAIYYCDRRDNTENYCKKFDVDKSIYYAIENDEHRLFIDRMGCNKSFRKIRIYTDGFKDENEFNGVVEKLKDGKYYLNVNRANGSFGAKWLSGTLEKIGVLTKEEEIDFCRKHDKSKSIIECPNKEYGENLKNLMLSGVVLRYGLWLQQRDQHMRNQVYKYLPDLDYTNIYSDDELLASCGFTPDEIEKTIDYLRHFDFSQNRNDVVRDYTGYEVDTDEDE